MELTFTVIFMAGFLTFFTPCIFPLIPVYISLLVGEGVEEIAENKKKKLSLLLNSIFFALGITLVFFLLGMSATAVGAFFVKNRDILRGLGGLLIFLFGLKFLGYLNVDFLDYEKRLGHGKFNTNIRVLNSFLIGFFFAFGWSPCLGPILGSILTYTAISTSSALKGGEYLLIYSLGLATPLILLSLFLEPVINLFKKARKWIPVIEKTTGVVLIVMGVAFIINKASFLEPRLIKYPTIKKSSSIVELKTKEPSSRLLCTEKQCGIKQDQKLETLYPAYPITLGIEIPKNRPVILDFYRSNCPICLKMVPIINAVGKNCTDKELSLIKIEINNPEAQELVKKYGILGVPTFIFLDKKGKEMTRLLGYQDINTLLKTLKIIIPNGKCSSFSKISNENN